MALTVILNGSARTFEALDSSANLADVVASLGLQADRVAAEWNGEIVPRADWGATGVRDGDKLEIVHFVGGGCGIA